jgi:hypothetical protein
MFGMIEALRLCLLRGHPPPGVHAQSDGHDQQALQRGYGAVPPARGIRRTAGGSLLSSVRLANTNTTRALARI